MPAACSKDLNASTFSEQKSASNALRSGRILIAVYKRRKPPHARKIFSNVISGLKWLYVSRRAIDGYGARVRILRNAPPRISFLALAIKGLLEKGGRNSKQ